MSGTSTRLMTQSDPDARERHKAWDTREPWLRLKHRRSCLPPPPRRRRRHHHHRRRGGGGRRSAAAQFPLLPALLPPRPHRPRPPRCSPPPGASRPNPPSRSRPRCSCSRARYDLACGTCARDHELLKQPPIPIVFQDVAGVVSPSSGSRHIVTGGGDIQGPCSLKLCCAQKHFFRTCNENKNIAP